jgi:hypothetical protein
MSDPVRLVILKNLTTLLQTVTFEDGIGNTHSLTGKVYRGRTTVGADVTPPFITVLESPETSRFNDVVGAHDGSLQRNDWILLIQGCVQATDDDFNWTGDNHPTDDAHRFMAKVKMVIGSIFDEESDDYLLGVAAIEGGSCDPGIVRDADPKVSSYPFFWLRLTLSVIEKRGDPFAI